MEAAIFCAAMDALIGQDVEHKLHLMLCGRACKGLPSPNPRDLPSVDCLFPQTSFHNNLIIWSNSPWWSFCAILARPLWFPELFFIKYNGHNSFSASLIRLYSHFLCQVCTPDPAKVTARQPVSHLYIYDIWHLTLRAESPKGHFKDWYSSLYYIFVPTSRCQSSCRVALIEAFTSAICNLTMTKPQDTWDVYNCRLKKYIKIHPIEAILLVYL